MDHFIKNHQNLSKNERVLGANEVQIEAAKEQGRSMVEMLGVLAIVGVLSVGAISGYRYAMNKYRANQMVNELNLLSHQVAIAMMSKNGLTGELKLGEPYDTTKKLSSAGYEFAFGCAESGDTTECGGQNTFYMTVNKVSEAVCKELEMVGEHLQYLESVTINAGGGCQSGNENRVNFVFALGDFMSKEELLPDDVGYCSSHGKYDSLTGSCSCQEGYTGSGCQVSKTCSEHGAWISDASYLEGGYCDCDSGYVGKDCQMKACKGTLLSASNWEDCDCPEGSDGPNCECQSGEKWDGTHCVTGETQECDNETPCLSGQYCFKESGEEFSSGKGQCRSVDADSYTFGKYVASKVTMTGWSAKRFCQAQSPSKRLVTVDDLSCKPTICASECVEHHGYCHKNSPDTSVSIKLSKDLSDWPTELWTIRKEVYIANGNTVFWTGTNGSSFGNSGYVVALDDGQVVDDVYFGNPFVAICQ